MEPSSNVDPSNPVPNVGGNSDNASNGNAGPSYVNRNTVSNSNSNIGARLYFPSHKSISIWPDPLVEYNKRKLT